MAESKKHVTTQCNMFILNKPKTGTKGSMVNIKSQTKNKASQTERSSSTQSDQPARVTSTAVKPKALTSPSTSDQIEVVAKYRNVQTQCNTYKKSEIKRVKSTQTLHPDSSTIGIQCSRDTIDITATSLDQAVYILKSTPELWILSYEVKKDLEGKLTLVISRSDLFGAHCVGLESIQVALKEDGDCYIHKLFAQPEFQQLNKSRYELNVGEFVNVLRSSFLSDLVLCPGISDQDLDEMSIDKVVTTNFPSRRHQSKKCLQWHKAKGTRPAMCIYCKYTTKYIIRNKKRQAYETPTRKLKRRQTQSNYSFHKLTPVSKKARYENITTTRRYYKNKATKLELYLKQKEMTLSLEQSSELAAVVNTIETNHKKELQELITSTTNDKERQAILSAIWEKDLEIKRKAESRQFFEDQSRNKPGDSSNKWSTITYRMALAVYCRSPAAYNALKGFAILKLPSVRSLQTKTSKFLDSPGINHSYLKEQAEYYKEFIEEKRAQGKKVPFGEGILIFDEVKVIDQIMWNSKNHEFIGLALTPEEFPYLNDIFLPDEKKVESEPKPAKYMLQFVWRDLASDFDMIGPYFSCLDSLKHKFILGCLIETMRVCHAYGFKIKCLVCDGASENLAMIKSTLKHKGVFGYTKSAEEKYDFSIKCSFHNYFDEGSLCHWIICPSHQLKNMISALHSSRGKGPKDFVRNGEKVGWEDIQHMKSREEERFQRGQIRCVPGLLQAYIIRDPWTRLNVKPAKIMQQEAVLAELYAHGKSKSLSSGSAAETYKYLRACNKLFENGFLSKSPITSSNSPTLISIQEGYSYFEDWVNEILMEDPHYKLSAAKQTKFLAWQTWDLLRICVFGVKALIADFTTNHPDHFLVLSRINGSVVESLFSQFKYATGSKLSSVNYAQARRSVIMKSNVHSSHSSNQDYRDVNLNIREEPL